MENWRQFCISLSLQFNINDSFFTEISMSYPQSSKQSFINLPQICICTFVCSIILNYIPPHTSWSTVWAVYNTTMEKPTCLTVHWVLIVLILGRMEGLRQLYECIKIGLRSWAQAWLQCCSLTTVSRSNVQYIANQTWNFHSNTSSAKCKMCPVSLHYFKYGQFSNYTFLSKIHIK